MLDKLRDVELKFEKLNNRLCESDISQNIEEYKSVMKEIKSLTPVVEKYREYKKTEETAKEAKELLEVGGLEPDFRDMVREEYETAAAQLEKCAEELKILLLPGDPNDDKNVIVEIRGGAGGEEASLFAGVLYRMYSMYAACPSPAPKSMTSCCRHHTGVYAIYVSLISTPAIIV